MKIIRINNLVFLEILSFMFNGENWGNLAYKTKRREVEFQAKKFVAKSECLLLKTNHFENYKLTGDFEIYDTNTVSPIFGIIKVNGYTTIQVSGKEINLPNGVYEIRTRITLDLYDKYGYKRWQIEEPVSEENSATLNNLDNHIKIFSTYDSCGSDFRVTNVAHCDYHLSIYKDLYFLDYHHDCNGRGSNGLEFDCFFVIYDNLTVDHKQLTEFYEKIWVKYSNNNSTMKMEVPLFQRHDAPDNVLGIFERVLRSMSRRILSENQIHAPNKICLIVKGLTNQLKSWEHAKNKINEYKSLLEMIDSPLTLNLILKKYKFMDFLRLAEAEVVESQNTAVLFKLSNGSKILALRNQDDSFDISEVSTEIDKIADAILWSFDLTHEDVLAFDTVEL